MVHLGLSLTQAYTGVLADSEPKVRAIKALQVQVRLGVGRELTPVGILV